MFCAGNCFLLNLKCCDAPYSELLYSRYSCAKADLEGAEQQQINSRILPVVYFFCAFTVPFLLSNIVRTVRQLFG